MLTRWEEIRMLVGLAAAALLGWWAWHPLAVGLPCAFLVVWLLRVRHRA